MRVAHFGTFDVESYDDLLLPRLLEHRLSSPEFELVHVARLGGHGRWAGCAPTVSARDFAADPGQIDAVIVGGELLQEPARGSSQPQSSGETVVPAGAALWFAATVAAAHAQAPCIWNAPWLSRESQGQGAEALRWAATASSLLCVRDANSAKLVEAATGLRPAIAADPSLDATAIWTPQELGEDFEQSTGGSPVTLPQRLIAVHLDSRSVTEPLADLGARLDRIARMAEAKICLLALDLDRGDDRLAARAAEHVEELAMLVDRPRSLRQVASLIARSRLYLGSSRGAMFTAMGLGTPGAIIATSHQAGVAGIEHPAPLASWAQAEVAAAGLLGTEAEADARDLYMPALDVHWDQIRSTILNGGFGADEGDGTLADLERIVGAAPRELAMSALGSDTRRALAAQRARANRRQADIRAELSESQRRLARANATLVSLEQASVIASERERELIAQLEVEQRQRSGLEERVEIQMKESEAQRHEAALLTKRLEAHRDALTRREHLKSEAQARERELIERERDLSERLAKAVARERELAEQAEAQAAERSDLEARLQSLMDELDLRHREAGKLQDRLDKHRKLLGVWRRRSERYLAREQKLAQALDDEARRREGLEDRIHAQASDLAMATQLIGERSGPGEALLELGLEQAAEDVRAIGASRTWRWGRRIVGLGRLALGQRGKPSGARAPESTIKRIELVLGREPGENGDPTPLPAAADASQARRQAAAPVVTRRDKVTVVAWDAGHNPMGRAYLLAEMLSREYRVEIVAAAFARYGDETWPPLRGAEIPISTFPGRDLPEHFSEMEKVARRISGSAVVVSKPRLPSLGLGVLAKELDGRPLILDVDDRELAFFGDASRLDLDGLREEERNDDIHTPFGRLWTRYCDSLIPNADAVTVSSPQLQALYGGTIIPHARDEARFDPGLYDRDDIRARYGLRPTDKVIVFIGTPRLHKGLLEIVDALEQIGDKSLKLCIVGKVTEPPLLGRLQRSEHVVLVGDRPFGELPGNLLIGDLMCLLSDPASEIARYQMPAKFTDALAMGVPIVARSTPPLADAVGRGLAIPVTEEPLAKQLAAVFGDIERHRAEAQEHRQAFLTEFSYAAVAPRLASLVRTKLDEPRTPLAAPFRELLRYQRDDLGSSSRDRSSSNGAGHVPVAGKKSGAAGGKPSAARSQVQSRPYLRPRTAGRGVDIVCFWKQNDTGIFGRRNDMLVEHLARHDSIHRLLHFDAPISYSQLSSLSDNSGGKAISQNRQVLRGTLRRIGGIGRRDGKIHRYTFAYADADRDPRAIRAMLPRHDDYLGFLADAMARNGLGDRPLVLLVWPRNFEFPSIADALGGDLIVADVVDDHRTWVDPAAAYHERLERNYQDILGISDLVIANCSPVQDAMRRFTDEVHLIPNGCDLRLAGRKHRRPRELRRLDGPIIGYVGNLSSRIDIDLLRHLAQSRPQWQLVLIGSTHLDETILELQDLANVHFLGVKPYPGVADYISSFDVALIPHLNDRMTKTMHPLKALVYLSLGVPTVSTQIPNLGELTEVIPVAGGQDEFVGVVEKALADGRNKQQIEAARSLTERNSWDRRAATFVDLIGDRLGTEL